MLDFNSIVKQTRYTVPHVSNTQNPTTIDITLSIDDNVKDELNVESKNTIIQYNSESENSAPINIQGFNNEYFLRNEYLGLLDEIESLLQNESLKKYLDIRKICFDHMSSFHKVSWQLNTNALKSLAVVPEKKDAYLRLVKELEDYIEKLYSKFPKVLYYQEEQLSNFYSLVINNKENFEKKHGAGLINLLKAINISVDYFEEKTSTKNPSVRRNFSDEFQSKINRDINIPFNKFYLQEDVQLISELTDKYLRFYVKSHGKNIEFKERSNGLKWYLSLFIALQAENERFESILFVIDEPAVSLHVDAQVEIEKLFYQLPSNVQLVFSTHSPFLINDNKLVNLRAVQKNDDGNTNIINSINSNRILGSSNKETLSPILNAIGMSGTYALGIDSSKINIITEGFTDAMYLNAMSKILCYNNDFSFIASVGAPQVINIALILQAWNLEFVCLLDSDKAGVLAKTTLDDCDINKIAVIQEVIGENGTIEDIIDKSEFEKINSHPDNSEVSKKLIAKLIIDNWNKNNSSIAETTKENFLKLFKILKTHIS